MRRRILRAVAGTLALTLLGASGNATPHPRAGSERPPVARASAEVFHAYLAALAAIRRPKALSFDYTVSQLGVHDMEQTHRVYRSGLDERDETLFVDGYTLKAPAVRILRNRTYRYDLTSVAPRPAQYAFAFRGATRTLGTYAYTFRTAPRSARAFEVLEVEIDGRTLLPAVVRFRIAGGKARGVGSLRYGLSDSHWVVREARVTAKIAGGRTARERIAWSNYRFYDALPKSTFDAPKPAVSPPLTTGAPAAPPPVAGGRSF